MYLLALGLILLLMKSLQWGPVALWPWWWVLLPFGLAIVWWAWADGSGYTKKKATEAAAKRIAERRKRSQDALNSTHRE